MNRTTQNPTCTSLRALARAAAITLAAWTATPAVAQDRPVVDFIPDLPGGANSVIPQAVSVDGRFVVGRSMNTAGMSAILWTDDSPTLDLGDVPGGNHQARALAVSDDGAVVAGVGKGQDVFSIDRAFRWTAADGIVDLGTLAAPRARTYSRAYAITADGSTIFGASASSRVNDDLTSAHEAFRWEGSMRSLGVVDNFGPGSNTEVRAVTPDGTVQVGTGRVPLENGFFGTRPVRRVGDGRFEILGDPVPTLGGLPTTATGVSDDGSVVVGATGILSLTTPWRWTADGGFVLLAEERTGGAVGVSGNGLVTLDAVGRLWIGNAGPFALLDVLATFGVTELDGHEIKTAAISRDGLNVVGHAMVPGAPQPDQFGFRVRFHDCDENGLADELEMFAGEAVADVLASAGTERFRIERETVRFESMIAAYGTPWSFGSNQTATLQGASPASQLRALRQAPDCGNLPEENFARHLLDVALPAAVELAAHEMLLGNEAFGDAMDPTIGLDGILSAELGDQFAFAGVRDVDTLLDEELALLRGRALDGGPTDWLDDTLHFPEFIGSDGPVRAAIYNRLPPNAGGTLSIAYRSNYRVSDDAEAAAAYPQGHGDAYGYYLSATKALVGALARTPEHAGGSQALDALHQEVARDDALLTPVRSLADAAAARARTAREVTELTFRSAYQEDPEAAQADEVFEDADAERAWSTVDWARRGFLGAYLDWSVLASLTPADVARPVNRENVDAFDTLGVIAAELQERADTVGGGLDPLGLLPNVVPFGIDASGLDATTGRSHYEQVRDAAKRAIDNARRVLEIANEPAQRLRETDQSFEAFEEQAEDFEAEIDQQLVELFGLPSADDPVDNDRDPTTNDLEESRSKPDLVNFMVTDDGLNAARFAPRAAPGEIQLAFSELRVAALRVDEVEIEIDNLTQTVRDQLDRIQLVKQIQVDRLALLSETCEAEISFIDRLETIDQRERTNGLLGSAFATVGQVFTNPAGAIQSAAGLMTDLTNYMADQTGDNRFDIDRERQLSQCWKEQALQGFDDTLGIEAEYDRLDALMRQTPLLLISRATAIELVNQAVGRLNRAIQRGRSLANERDRVNRRLDSSARDEQYRDLAFRVFRNNTLEKYRAFFDLAARYVALAARAYAYEFNAKADGENVLSGIWRERLLGVDGGVTGGLEGVLLRLDNSVVVNNFNRPLESLGQREFSFRTNMLGIGTDDFPNDDLTFRQFIESHIVERVEAVPEIAGFAQVSTERDHGPGIVIPFTTEIAGRNIFGRGPDLPFGNANFSLTRNAKIRSYAIRFDGVESAIGIDQRSGTVFVYLLPVGESVLRANTNSPRIEEEIPTPWSVVSQFLPAPPLISASDVRRRSFNPWTSTAQAGGNYLNAIRRQRDSEAQIELDQPLRLNTNLAGRSVWNTRWLLVIPGSQWTSSDDPAAIRNKVLQFIYGTTADPEQLVGIADIRLVINAYSH